MYARNIVQAEFFLAGRDAESLEELQQDIFARSLDGAPSKVCVRFYEEGSDLVECIRPYEGLREKEIELLGEAKKEYDSLDPSAAARFKRKVLTAVAGHPIDRAFRALGKQREEIKTRANELVRAQLETIARSTREIAIETGDYSYRMVRGEELHELMERVERAHGLWLFIFEPNELLADSNELLASMSF